MCASLPILGMVGYLFVYSIQNYKRLSLECYGCAGAVAEQALGQIKTVKALSGEDHEKENY